MAQLIFVGFSTAYLNPLNISFLGRFISQTIEPLISNHHFFGVISNKRVLSKQRQNILHLPTFSTSKFMQKKRQKCKKKERCKKKHKCKKGQKMDVRFQNVCKKQGMFNLKIHKIYMQKRVENNISKICKKR